MPNALTVLASLYNPRTLCGCLLEHIRQADVDAMRFLVDGQVGLSQLRENDAAYLRRLLRERRRGDLTG